MEAIQENEVVIQRMEERIELVRVEVERRGVGWSDIGGMIPTAAPKVEEGENGSLQDGENAVGGTMVNGSGHGGTNGAGGIESETHPAWRDGTFTTGTISGGRVQLNQSQTQSQAQERRGGSLSDEELRRRLEETMGPDVEEEDGMYL